MSTTSTETYKIAVVGAGGKMGMRVSDNLRQDRPPGRVQSRTRPRASSARSMRAAS